MITNATIIFVARMMDHRILNNFLDNLNITLNFWKHLCKENKLWGSCYAPPPKLSKSPYTLHVPL